MRTIVFFFVSFFLIIGNVYASNITNSSSLLDLLVQTQTIELEIIPSTASIFSSNVYYIKKNSKYIMVFSQTDVFLWNTNGKFIGRIGQIGKGPGEYQSVGVAYFDSENTVGVNDPGRRLILLFDIIDKSIIHKETIDIMPILKYSPSDIHVLDNGNKLFICTSYPKNMPRYIITDRNFGVVFSGPKNSVDEAVTMGGSWIIGKKHFVISDIWTKKGKNIERISNKIFIYNTSASKENIVLKTKKNSMCQFMMDTNEKYVFDIDYSRQRIDIYSLKTKKWLHDVKLVLPFSSDSNSKYEIIGSEVLKTSMNKENKKFKIEFYSIVVK